MAAPAKKDDAKQEDTVQAQEQPATGGGRARGIEALSPTDRQSAELTDSRVIGKASIQRGPGHTTAKGLPEEVRTGSVLPYKIDGIDVDSFDARTPQEIQAQREKEAKR